MKKLITILLVMAVASGVAMAKIPMMYKVKSAMVVYNISGSMNGTETLYFDDYGKKEYRLTSTKVSFMGFSTETQSLNLRLNEVTYTVDLKEKTGTKMTDKEAEEMLKKLSKGNPEDMADEVIKQLGGRKLGNETVMGKNCEVWEFTKIGTKGWYYKMVALKIEMNMMGMNFLYTADKYEENPSIPAGTFDVPKGIKFEEMKAEDMPNMDELMKQMQQGGGEE